jgi:hypothetical protein
MNKQLEGRGMMKREDTYDLFFFFFFFFFFSFFFFFFALPFHSLILPWSLLSHLLGREVVLLASRKDEKGCKRDISRATPLPPPSLSCCGREAINNFTTWRMGCNEMQQDETI